MINDPVFNVLHQPSSSSSSSPFNSSIFKKKKFSKLKISKPQIPKAVLTRMRTYTDSDQRQTTLQPPLPERKKHHFIAISIGGTLLTLNAGFINAVTALHSGLFSSHVSGDYTRAGIYIEQQNFKLFIQFFMLII